MERLSTLSFRHPGCAKLWAALACTSATACAPVGQVAPTVRAPAAALPSAARVHEEQQGTFVFISKGREVGREHFRFSRGKADQRLMTSTKLEVAGGALTVDAELFSTHDWRPLRGHFTVTHPRGRSRLELKNRGQTLEMVAEERVVATAPSGEVDVYLGQNILTHLTAICTVTAASNEERGTLTAYPGLHLSLSVQPAAVARGGERLRARGVVIEPAGGAPVQILCDGERLVGAWQPEADVIAYREDRDFARRYFEGMQRESRAAPALNEESATIAFGGTDAEHMNCSLSLPEARPAANKTYAAVAFVSGSGVQDRDGDGVGVGGSRSGLFRSLARELARHDVAALRCDDPRTRDGHDVAFRVRVSAVQAMLSWLRVHRHVRPTSIALLGHSEGGTVANAVARQSQHVGALVLLAAPGRRMPELIVSQIKDKLRAEGASPAKLERVEREYRAAFQALTGARQTEAPVLTALGRSEIEWLRSRMDHDPLADASAINRTPVFIGQGAADQQVSVADAEMLRRAFRSAGNESVVYKVYRGLNHVLREQSSSSSPEVRADVLRDVGAFLARSLNEGQ